MLYKLILDFETRSELDVNEVGAWVYAEHPSTEIICLSYRVKNDLRPPALWQPILYREPLPSDLTAFAQDLNCLFEAHNVQFERAIWENIMVPRWGAPAIDPRRYRDTQALCAHKAIPLDLDGAGQVLRLVNTKYKSGKALLNKVSKPRNLSKKQLKEYNKLGLRNPVLFNEDPELLRQTGEYCQNDVRAEEELGAALGHELPEKEAKIWQLDQEINARGIKLDAEGIRAARELALKMQERFREDINELTDGEIESFNQTEAMSEWCLRVGGYAPENWQAEHIDRELASGELPEPVHKMCQLRRLAAKASTAKLDTMLKTLCADGRSRGVLQYQGASTTGRWAGRNWQPHNLPTGVLNLRPADIISVIRWRRLDALEAIYGDPLTAISDSIRGFIMADQGRELVAGDYSAIEARIVLALAEQWDKVQLLADGFDPYCHIAKRLFGYEVTKKDNPYERYIGKQAVLGLGFQCGAPNFQNKFLPDEPLEFCQTTVDTYRKEWAPNVPQLWYSIEDAAVTAVYRNTPVECGPIVYALEDEWLTCRLPSGRKLYYRSPGVEMKMTPWGEYQLGLFYYAKKYGQWCKVHAYGGLLVENIVQAIARDLLAEAMLRARQVGLPLILTVHDEIVSEPLKDTWSPKQIEELMVNDQPHWVKECGIPVAVEAWKGQRYRK